jgi:hypothetical protein
VITATGDEASAPLVTWEGLTTDPWVSEAGEDDPTFDKVEDGNVSGVEAAVRTVEPNGWLVLASLGALLGFVIEVSIAPDSNVPELDDGVLAPV